MIRLPSTCLVLILVFANTSNAESNRKEIQNHLQTGWDSVFFGKELSHSEYLKFAGGIATLIGTGSPAPLATLVEMFLEDSIQSLSKDITKAVLFQAVRNPGKIFRSGEWDLDFGIATYRHSTVIKVEIPDRVEIRGFESKIRMRVETIRTDLPNTHQPYVRIRKVAK